MAVKIPWYVTDARFKPGTVADVGDIRLELRKTDRAKNNKWRLYLYVRVNKEHGIKDDLKRGVAVAEFDGKLSLEQAQAKADEYMKDFVLGLVASTVN